jgi:NAD-dependent DNA ligase
MKYKIHLSGFSQEEKDKYKDLIEGLGGQFHSNLMTFTNIFICESVKNSKYKPALILGAEIMSKEWLDECDEQKKFLSLDNNKLPIL